MALRLHRKRVHTGDAMYASEDEDSARKRPAQVRSHDQKEAVVLGGDDEKAPLHRLASLRENEHLHDVTVVFDGLDGRPVTQKHNSVILVLHSKYFEKAFLGPFKEASEKSIRLQDDDPAALIALFEYCYTLSYKEPRFTKEDNASVLLQMKKLAEILMLHASVATVADKYLIPPLHDKAVRSFSEALHRSFWKSPKDGSTVCRLLTQTVASLYAMVPVLHADLRDVIGQWAFLNLDHLRAFISPMLEAEPRFAVDITKSLLLAPSITDDEARKHLWLSCRVCHHCFQPALGKRYHLICPACSSFNSRADVFLIDHSQKIPEHDPDPLATDWDLQLRFPSPEV